MDQQANSSNGGQVPSSHVEQHQKKKEKKSYTRYKEQQEPMQSHDFLCEKERHTGFGTVMGYGDHREAHEQQTSYVAISEASSTLEMS